jgi:hypothetical protein
LLQQNGIEVIEHVAYHNHQGLYVVALNHGHAACEQEENKANKMIPFVHHNGFEVTFMIYSFPDNLVRRIIFFGQAIGNIAMLNKFANEPDS